MDPISLLIKFLKAFVWFDADENEVTRTIADAKEWWARILYDDDAFAKAKAENAPGHTILLMRWRKWSANWYAKVLYSIIFLWLMKSFPSWMEGDEKETEDDD